MPEMLLYVLWGIGGAGVGIVLGWWQSRTIKKFEQAAPEKIMGRAYLSSVPRILLVTALLFAAMTQGIWYGICFAVGFTLSRWVWTWIMLRKLKGKGN